MKQYFTYRLFPTIGGKISPDVLLRDNFDQMAFTFKIDIAKKSGDGRILGWVEAATQDEVDAILEGLAAFGVHRKTIAKAQAFAQSCLPDLVVEISGESLVTEARGKVVSL